MDKILNGWANDALIHELSEGTINAPQDLLGCHEFKERKAQIITAYRPCAWHVWLLDGEGQEIGEMLRLDGIDDLFGFAITKKKDYLKKYRFRIQYGDDDFVEIEDPYAFPKQITDFDITSYFILFNTMKILFPIFAVLSGNRLYSACNI